MMQRVRAENQLEPLGIRKVHQIADLVANVLTRLALAGDANQRLTDIDTNDLIKSLSQGNRVAAGSASSIERSVPVSGQLRQQPVQQRLWRVAGGPVVVLGEAIE
jgi:hypothetical protein